MKTYWAVGYTWTVGDATRIGHTVVTATSQAEAEAKYARLYKHITVLPLAQWNELRRRVLASAA